MLIGQGAVAHAGRTALPVGAAAIEGEYLARGHADREPSRQGGSIPRPSPIRTPNTVSVDLYLRTGRPWAAPRQGRHIDLYV